METILIGVVGFTIVILALVLILMAARSQLVQSGDVTILINGDPEKALKTPAGSTLLSTLAGNQIFIPSACGGKGSCGVCKVDVHEGGGAMFDLLILDQVVRLAFEDAELDEALEKCPGVENVVVVERTRDGTSIGES